MNETLSKTRGRTTLPRSVAGASAEPSEPRSGVADVVSALLSHPHRLDPSRLPELGSHQPPAPEESTDGRAPAITQLAPGVTGLGATAHRLATPSSPPVAPPAEAPKAAPSLVGLPGGLGTPGWWIAGDGRRSDEDAADSAMPELFCPGPVRDNAALGEEVNNRVVDWAEEVGIYPGQLDRLRACGFGHLIMLTHPATEDPDRLLAAAKCVVAEWAADDYYVDEVELGADPSVVGSRLALLYAVVDPAALPAQYAPQLDEHRRAEAIVTAFRSAMEHLARYASDTQIGRFQHQMGILFMAWSQEADWHRNGRTPPVWEYLVQRHLNSYLPPMILIDVMAGYEIPPHEFYDPMVRQAFTRAGGANVLLNDLHSSAFESETDFNLPRVICAEDGCSHEEAIKRTVELHNEQMRTFVAEAAALSVTGSPALQRFFVDTWAWMGGSREWHATSGRYHSEDA